ncbi:MAG: hypothetical protein QOA14_04510 [Nitrososphaeraceae archaeon]|nr:hypothetical protein [Nitrososphaeraceae archaeon]MDW0176507.1 hypothetical protein [Nitrososphaeraceae archaeon]MDW0178563.1 hypothetical protein [Nitrososphaeraceae archaeon]MDW0179929.1 hypothetical protein [Nitrososphaeraceae archaeon]MDW0182425.1 hypothetical protein [Nitrososphaeraceae archaeon]
MSLCYDLQKWTMLSLGLVAISLSVGILMEYAHGYIDPTQYRGDPGLVTKITQVNYWEKLVDYCFDHADRPNPLQDLRDKGFSVIGSDCKSVKQIYDEQLGLQNKMIANFTKNNPCAPIDPIERQYYPSCKGK